MMSRRIGPETEAGGTVNGAQVPDDPTHER